MNRCILFALTVLLAVSGNRALGQDFDATTQAVGHIANGLATPVNQLVTPAGTQVPLEGMRPNALALSPDGRLLVTSGLKDELIAVDPATGKIVQLVFLPPDKQLRASAQVSRSILHPRKEDKLSFTGLVFSPDGSRIYLCNVNGDIKVFSVDHNHHIIALGFFLLPGANAPERKTEIPTGLAVSPDGKQIFTSRL